MAAGLTVGCRCASDARVYRSSGTKFSIETRPGWTRLLVYEHTVDVVNLKGKNKHVAVTAEAARLTLCGAT